MSKDRKPLTSKNNLSEKEQALQQLKQTASEPQETKKVHRYNIEIPNDLFQEIKAFINEKGFNLKGFFLASAKEKIKRDKTV